MTSQDEMTPPLPPAVMEVAQALQRNDLNEAMALARNLVTAESHQADGLLLVSDVLMTARQWRELVDFLAPYIDNFPKHAPLQWVMAQAYTFTSQFAKAEPYLRYVVTAKPHWPRVHSLLGRNLFNAGRQGEAIVFLQEAARAEPENSKLQYILSLALASEGRYAEALPVMRIAKDLRPAEVETAWHHSELEELAKAPPAAHSFARWPNAAREFDDVKTLIDKYFVKNLPTAGMALRRQMAVFTQGSCFAENLAASLRRYDLRVDNMPCGEEHNNTFANRAILDWLRHGSHDDATAIIAAKLGEKTRERYLAALRDTDIFVYTMGIAAVHFDRVTGEFIMSRPTETSKAAMFRRSEFRNSTVQQNVDNLRYILGCVRELAPKAAVVLTVSPVPLRAATEFNSAIVADCLSKSTLRVAIHEVMAEHHPRTIYWPSFEMVRWLGGHIDGRVYGSDDGSAHHVDLGFVDHIMDAFIRAFGDKDLLDTRR